MKDLELINGDCMVEIKNVPSCRLLLTDIPYEEVNRPDSGLRNLDKGIADVKTFELRDFLECIYDSADIFIIFCENRQYSEIYRFFGNKQKLKKGTVRQLVWAKSNPSPMNGEYVYLSGTENAVWFKKSGTGKMNSKCKKNFFIHSTGSSKFHPTEKNHKLLEELILDNTNEGDLVVDCCMGSGSTGLVALKNNRRFYGIELNEVYFNIAQKRISDMPKANKITNQSGQSKELHNWELYEMKKKFEASTAYISWKANRLGANVEVFLEEMGYKIERLI